MQQMKNLWSVPEGAKVVLAVDPGPRCGWALASSPGRGREGPEQKLGLLAVGTSPADTFLMTATNMRGQIDHLVMEQSPAIGNVSGRNLAMFTGQLIALFAAGSPAYPSKELYLVGPGQWKQYPKRRIEEVTEWLSCEARFKPDSKHSKDALQMLAWWWLTTGKEVL